MLVVRGGGDIATGVVQKLWRCHFRPVVLETAFPSTIRRTVALSSAVNEGVYQVEDMRARLAKNTNECEEILNNGEIPVLVDPQGKCLPDLKADILVDAILAKRNLGTRRDMARLTVGLGPGFEAGTDVDVVVETMRGHCLGRLILQGPALANTGIPGEVGGKSKERVVHASIGGVVRHRCSIGDLVARGDVLFYIDDTPVLSPLDGVVRGLIANGFLATPGLKVADVDPRPKADVDCNSISDKARCIGGAVLEACFWLGREKGIL